MPIDIHRVVQAAVQAALEDPAPSSPPKKARLSTGRALLLGAGLMTAGRIVVASHGRDVLAAIQDRLAPEVADLRGHEDEPEAVVDDLDPEDGMDDEDEPAAEAVDDEPPPRARRGRAASRSGG
jgi:hypothetical protein